MSTSYTELKAPWSSIGVDDNGTHARIHVWNDGKKAGELVVASADRGDAVRSFVGMEGLGNSYGCNATTRSRSSGMSVSIHQRPRSRVVVSDYGEVIDWDQLLDEYPTADGRTITESDRWQPRA